VFGANTGYQCRNPGIGNPPLCEKHYEVVYYADNSGDSSNVIEEAVNLFVQHPRVQDVIDRFGSVLEEAMGGAAGASRSPPYEAECPPRPEGAHGSSRPTPEPPGIDARTVLHFGPNEPLSRELIQQRRRQLAGIFHPDKGGSVEQMQNINNAAEELLSQTP